MIRIGYNTTDKHYGFKTHLEKPERLNYTIKQLKEKYKHNQDIFLSSDLYLPTNKKESLKLICAVHSKEYLKPLIETRISSIICRNCKGKTSNILESVYDNNTIGTVDDFIVREGSCRHCDEEFCHENILTYLDGDTYYTPFTFDIVMEGVSVLKALIDQIVDEQIKTAFALIRPPGHHCCNRASGFCIVNNAVIATRYAQANGLNKVLILDIDFHHGDGTQQLITDENLLYKQIKNTHLISIHGYGQNIYPGTGSESESTENVLNIPINITIDPKSRLYVDDQFYQSLITNRVYPHIQDFNPDFIVVSLGLDAHKDDDLEGLNITDNTYIMIAQMLKQYNKPILFITEGGYNPQVINSVINNMLDVFA